MKIQIMAIMMLAMIMLTGCSGTDSPIPADQAASDLEADIGEASAIDTDIGELDDFAVSDELPQ